MPMTRQGRTLSYSLAALTAVAALALGFRLGAQESALAAAKGYLADVVHNAAELRTAGETGLGPPLLDAKAAPAADAFAQRLASLGFTVRKTQLVAATPAGRDLSVARFAVEGRADAVAIDRLALWIKANARSAILEQLSASAGPDGKSDVKIEVDALVRGMSGRAA
jgi:hypothetical protein